MSGCVVQIWFDDSGAVDKAARHLPFVLCETDFEDFAEFLEAVDADQLICVSRLDTRWGGEKGLRIVNRRVPLAFRGSALRRTQLPTWRIVDEEED